MLSNIKIPRFHQSSTVPINAENKQKDDNASYRNEKESANKTDYLGKDGAQTVNNLMTVAKNPSTIFKPPFGTNVDEHHSKLGEHAQNLWKYNKITDMTVKLEGVDYPCHKTVLSCYSKYFKDLLLDQKGTVSVIHLKLPSVTTVAFQVLLTYMYTSNLNLTCQNIGEVYTAARKLGIDGALILCTRILTGKSKHDVYSVYLYVTAKKLRLKDTAAKALKIMTRRFEHIVGTPEFLDLDFPQVFEYLKQDVLATRSEVIVFLAALKWLSVKYLDREQYATDLLCSIRFPMMTLNEVLACYSPPLLPGILEIKKIKDKLLAATCYVAAATVNEEKRFEQYSCRPRIYLLPREPVLLWDPSIFDPDRHEMYREEVAATTIQAAFRGYKARKSIEADKAAGLLQEPGMEQFEEFEPPKDDDDETYIQNGDGRRPSVSFMDSIRKSIVSLLGSSESETKTPSTERRTSKKSDTDVEDELKGSMERRTSKTSDTSSEDELKEREDSLSTTKTAPLRRSSSIDTLAGQVSSVAENTEIKKYTSDNAVDMSSEAFQRTLRKPETSHKIYTTPSLEEETKDERNLDQKSSASNEENETAKSYILATGGLKSDDEKDDSEGKLMFLYDFIKNEWISYGTMEKARHHHRLVLINSEVYVIGGCNPEKTKGGRMIPEKTCYKFDLESKKWSKISKMKHSRMYHGVAELNGKIYAVGGKDKKDRLLSSLEVYNPASNKWESDLPLETPTMGMGVCVHQGKLWAAGGMVQDNKGVISLLREVKCFDPEKKSWYYNIGKLPFPRAFATMVSFENQVFIIGGTSLAEGSQEEELSSILDVLYYDSKKNKWIPTTNLPFRRHFVEANVIGNDLYVLGGLSSYQRAAAVEVIAYDKETQKWRSCAPVPKLLSGFATVVIRRTSQQILNK